MASITSSILGSTGTFARTLALAGMFAVTATAAQAADSERITAPNPNDVAILRGLLALQHPALRAGAPVTPAAAAPAALTTEPSQPQDVSAPAIEGEACVSPDAGGSSMCGFQAETNAGRVRSLRVSLERSLAAAGYDTTRL